MPVGCIGSRESTRRDPSLPYLTHRSPLSPLSPSNPDFSTLPASPQVTFSQPRPDTYEVLGRLDVAMPQAAVYAVLSNYEGAHTVFSNIDSTAVTREADGAVTLVQTCLWRFWVFSGTFSITLGVVEDPGKAIVFSLKARDFMKKFEGKWEVEPSPREGGATHVRCVGRAPLALAFSRRLASRGSGSADASSSARVPSPTGSAIG